MNLKPKFWNADKIVSLSAILISLATMSIYLYQTHLIRKQQSASVMPYLLIGASSHNENHFSIEVVNNGLGPAFVEEVNVIFRGKKYKNSDLPQFFFNYNPQKDTLNFSYGSIISGMLVSSGKTIINIQANDKKSTIKMKEYFWSKGILDVEIIYASIYGEKWIVNMKNIRPKKIED
jgi:hypothetical protein